MTKQLIYQPTPKVIFATNTFINVPIILQFEDTPLVSVVREEDLGFTTEIPIYHADGTYLAKVRGTRVYATDDGKKAGIEIRQLADAWVCEIEGRTVFEIQHQPGDAFKTQAELFTPTGHFVKVANSPKPDLYDASGEALTVGGATMVGNTISDFRIGVLIREGGGLAIGVN